MMKRQKRKMLSVRQSGSWKTLTKNRGNGEKGLRSNYHLSCFQTEITCINTHTNIRLKEKTITCTFCTGLSFLKMMKKEINLQDYLFNTDVYELPPHTRLEITDSIRREMIEIFSGRNIY